MGWRRLIGLALLLAVVALTVIVFLAFDHDSHSVSDTLRPFLITMTPLWLLAGWAVHRLLARRSTP